MKWLWVLAATALSAQPVITDLQPHGVQKGRPFTLTVTGRNLGEGNQDPVQHARDLYAARSRTNRQHDGGPNCDISGRA